MVRNYVRSPRARSYRSYSATDLQKAVRLVQSGKQSLRKTCAQYNIPLGTLSNKCKNKFCSPPGHPTVFTTEEEHEFVKYIQMVGQWGFPFDYTDLRLFAKTYLSKIGRRVPQFKNNLPSVDWARAFVKRHKESLVHRRCQNIKRARAKVSQFQFSEYFSNLEKVLTNPDGSKVPSSNIFNYDETNLSDDPGTKKCLFKRGVKYPDRVRDSSKSATSIMFCGSADGTMLPSYVVYKSEHLWSTWTEGGPPNTRYNRSYTDWFDSHCFSDWFETVFVRGVSELSGRKVIIGDNLSSHFSEKVLSLAKDNNISFTCLPPNSTHLAQPLDVAFYGPLKRSWRIILDEWKTSQKKRSALVTTDAFPGLLRKLYSKMYPSGSAEKSTNLIAGFKKCGINPLNPKAVLDRIPGDLCHTQELTSTSGSSTSGAVSDAVIDILKTMRGVNDSTDQEPRQRKRRIATAPGCSVSVEDIEPASSGSKDERKKSGQKKKKKQHREEEDGEENEDENEPPADGKLLPYVCYIPILVPEPVHYNTGSHAGTCE